MDLFTLTVPQFLKTLRNLDRWLEAANELAAQKKFEPDVLLQQRLAPDQFALVRQVQSACDSAKLAAARLTGKDAPVHPDTETTMVELRKRIADVAGWLEGLRPADFVGADERRVSLGFMQGKWAFGSDYLVQFAIPNFYFHIVTAYSILRHNGVALGKLAYIGGLTLND
jgi:uncharacterized protein